MPNPAHIRLEYGKAPARRVTRRDLGNRVVVAGVLALLLLVAISPDLYTEYKWGKLGRGMTRKQVNAELWAFRRYAFPQYGGLGPGQSCIRYELRGLGEWTMIQVIYEPDGTVNDAQPSFDN